MNILYGVCGVGFGHSSRALVVAKYLRDKGHNVKILTYGDAYEVLKDEFDCFEVDGLDIVFENGNVNQMKTVISNLKSFSKNAIEWKKFHDL